MPRNADRQYKLFDDPFKYFNAMLDDIENAKDYIFLETYKLNNDSIGIKFRDALSKKSKEGVKIKLLLDSWGTSLPSNFFTDIINNGGEVRYFQKLKFFWDFFTKNHRRNHRKLLIIDDKISYIGSANLTDYSLNWRESMVRIRSDISATFKDVFEQQYNIYNNYVFEQLIRIRKLTHGKCEIVRDAPSLTKQRIRKRYMELIKSAKKEVVIETPYFLPGFLVRKSLIEASKRGVVVNVIMPKHSDVGLIDILRTRYLGLLHKNNIKILFFGPNNLHAKILMIDRTKYSVGSPNFDYRSFRYQHEIVVVGENRALAKQINSHIAETIDNCEKFNYEIWFQRSAFQKFFEWILLPLRHLL